jgi:DNA-binding transcriptional regulator YdaS (Cro superfamily)
METQGVYADTLKIAAETVGGSRNLAQLLGVRPDELARWMSGGQPAPLEPFLRALEIIEV